VFHLINTFILLAALAATAWLSSTAKLSVSAGNRRLLLLLSLGLAGMLVLGASGALTALGDTLFPSRSLAEGVQQDFSPTSHFLIQLRVLHPTIAVVVGVYAIALAGIVRMQVQEAITQQIARVLTLGVLIQLAAGLVNLLLLAPVWMQIVHLLLADLVWIILVLLTLSSLGLGYNSRL
jgi:heme A synthase